MNLILTGASGFVGKNLYQNFAPFYNINCVNLRDEINHNLELDHDCIIHLAGKAHDLKNVSDPEEYYRVNFEITKKLYDSFLRSDAKKFIFVSSVKAVSDSPDSILTEDTLPNPKTHYGKSKLMAEEYIKSHSLTGGKKYYILRPCMIHGPGNKGNLNLLYKFVTKGIPYPLAGFHNQRSYLSIDNLCFIIKELVDREDIQSGIYNISDDEALSTNEVVSILSWSINKKPSLWKIPKQLITFCAKIGDLLRLPLSTERLNKLTDSYVVSNDKIKKSIGSKLPLTSKEGLTLTARSFKNDIIS